MFLLSSCGPQIYKASNINTVASTHHTVAILPASVSITLRPNQMKKMSGENLYELAQKTGYDVQDKMYGWFLRKGSKFNYSVSFQDINTTNSILNKAGISYEDLKNFDRGELASKLGVDAVLDSRIIMDKPMSDGAAIAMQVLIGTYGTTNHVHTTVNLYDTKSGTLLWKYDHDVNGSTGSSADQLVNALMRNVSRKLPYRQS